MGALEQAIEKAVAAICEKKQIVQVLTGTAIKVGATTCSVERDGAPTLEDVRLDAIDDELTSRFTVYPAENSSVLVGIIEGVKTEAVILKCSEVAKVSFKAGTQTLVMNKDGFVFNAGTDGMVKLTELVSWMDKVSTDLNTLTSLLSTSPVAGNGAVLGIVFNPTTPTPVKAAFEDSKIKH